MRTAQAALMIGGALLASGWGSLEAQSSATQVVTFGVLPAREASASAPSLPLAIPARASARAGTSAILGSASYALTTNEANQKVAVGLDRPMPSGLVLSVALGAPAGAASVGAVPVSVISADLVTGIPALSSGSFPASFVLSASATPSGATAGTTRIVTFTIVAGQ